MSSLIFLEGRGLPLRGNDIDTDRIIPARFLRCVTFEGLGEQVFADDRSALGGKHPFDLPQHQGATLLVVNGNFGCGSSREHAPQAILKWGIRALIGESFAEIFQGNCLANGLACVTAAPEVIQHVQSLLEASPDSPLKLSLQDLTLGFKSETWPVYLPESARQMLLSGAWDSCAQLSHNPEAIAETAQRLPYLSWGAA
ncbi:MAG: 3-isopropylmalate dehydratase small subunit [Cyanobacteriota bacterium]|nr:3-isopropylmalate dehydratase small subunit [Cyanobacteriota bacterium]